MDVSQQRLGVYAGTFNPFHIGHQNIYDKAKKIFDAVFLLVGVNPDKAKEPTYVEVPGIHSQYIHYWNGYTTDAIRDYREFYKSVTLIRGIRNSTDYAYEMNSYTFMRELLPDLEIILIPCDKQYEHISSSALRKLQHFGDDFNHYLTTPLKK